MVLWVLLQKNQIYRSQSRFKSLTETSGSAIDLNSFYWSLIVCGFVFLRIIRCRPLAFGYWQLRFDLFDECITASQDSFDFLSLFLSNSCRSLAASLFGTGWEVVSCDKWLYKWLVKTTDWWLDWSNHWPLIKTSAHPEAKHLKGKDIHQQIIPLESTVDLNMLKLCRNVLFNWTSLNMCCRVSNLFLPKPPVF